MGSRLRRSVRGLIFDERESLLLYRIAVPRADVTVWTAPGGGIEPGETPLQALARELDEEVGLRLPDDVPHVWHQLVEGPDVLSGYDGIVNDYYLIRTARFTPAGSLGEVELAREFVGDFEWWSLDRLQDHRADTVFGPRDLPALVSDLLSTGPPDTPVPVGL